MSEQTQRTRRRAGIAIGVGVVVIALAVIGVVATKHHGGSQKPATAKSSASATPIPFSTAPPKVVKSTGPATPHPTRKVTFARPAPAKITRGVTAQVVRMRAVKGRANAPGQIAGPSIQFSIKITNSTDKKLSLINTVVNGFYGPKATPAVQLLLPGGKPFPQTVKAGGSAVGVYIFNIPRSARGNVQLTVDTSVDNPVIEFKGRAPQ